MSLTDTISLKAAQQFLLPTSIIEVKHVCWGYHRVLTVLLGWDHLVSTAFGSFTRLLETKEVFLNSYFFSHVERCAGILRFIQMRMFNWVHAQLLTKTVGHHHQCPPSIGTLVVQALYRSRVKKPCNLTCFFVEC